MRHTTISGRPYEDFTAVVERHRHELLVHCYRMIGSYTDAEDLVQETFLRAWRGHQDFEGRSSLRAWLYRIATNACLDALEHSSRRVLPAGPATDPLAELPGLQPFPDRVLDRVAPAAEEPDSVAVTRETIELAFLAAVQHLPPRQRAAVILRDVLGWTGAETASTLQVSVATANSLVQRARATLHRHRPGDRLAWAPADPTPEERDLVATYMEAHRRADAATIVAMLADDAEVTMPPEAPCRGRESAAAFFRTVLGAGGPGDWRLLPTRANRQPATANYLRRPGEDGFRATSIDVLRIEHGLVTAINCFLGDALFPAFGLPPRV